MDRFNSETVSTYLSQVTPFQYALSLGALTLSFLFWFRRPKLVKPLVDLNNQSVEVPGEDYVRVHPDCQAKGLVFTSELYGNASTIYECFKRGVSISPDRPCLGWRTNSKEPYQWITYAEVEKRSLQVGSGLIQKGCKPGNDTYIGIYSQNRVEWILMEQGCLAYSMINVALYDTLGPDACSFIINQARIGTVMCDSGKKLDQLLGQADKMPLLKLIIVSTEKPTEEHQQKATECGIELILLQDLQELGEKNPQKPKPPKPDDIYTICYTSGTTGDPKGAMLTHRNTVSNAITIMSQANYAVNFDYTDCHLSYLPLAHMFERSAFVTVFLTGARAAFFQGDVKKLMEDLQEVKPTIFISVPRLLNRIYDKITGGVANSSGLKRSLFNLAYSRKLKEVSRGIVRKDSIWDILVFRKLQNLLGGNVKVIITGAAPLSSEVMTFLRVTLGCMVMEGYGQTEASAGITFTNYGDISQFHVGGPLQCNMIKLCDVPEMDYFASNDKGEVCAKGHNVFKGYINNPEKTKEALDKDGWLHTGDIGQWLPNGTLKIIDRKKHIFKLAQGEYIAPEKIENIYTRSPLVAQIYVYGESLKASLVAIVVPDEDALAVWSSKQSISGSTEELCQTQELKKAILEDIHKFGKSAGLHSFEQVKDIYLQPEPFSVENGLLTPTFKSKRPYMKKYFSQQIESMYTRLA